MTNFPDNENDGAKDNADNILCDNILNNKHSAVPPLCLCCLSCFFGCLLFFPSRFARKNNMQNDGKYQ